jgi:predicted protein tyrosine phosphatase
MSLRTRLRTASGALRASEAIARQQDLVAVAQQLQALVRVVDRLVRIVDQAVTSSGAKLAAPPPAALGAELDPDAGQRHERSKHSG